MHTFELIELYDTNPNMTIRELARISGRSEKAVKRILMSAPTEQTGIEAYISEGLGQ